MMGMKAKLKAKSEESIMLDHMDEAFLDTGNVEIIKGFKGDPKAWWQCDPSWRCINVGGGIETIWLKKGNTVWAGLQGKQWYHTGEGGPSNWKCWSQPSPQVQMLKIEVSKLQKQVINNQVQMLNAVAKLTKMLAATQFATSMKKAKTSMKKAKAKTSMEKAKTSMKKAKAKTSMKKAKTSMKKAKAKTSMKKAAAKFATSMKKAPAKM